MTSARRASKAHIYLTAQPHRQSPFLFGQVAATGLPFPVEVRSVLIRPLKRLCDFARQGSSVLQIIRTATMGGPGPGM